MTHELVTRLKHYGSLNGTGLIGRLMLQAAQEIERLHGDLKAEKALVDRLTNPPITDKETPTDPLEQAREAEARIEANAKRAVSYRGGGY